MEKERSYIAFISYRHLSPDKEAAREIQRKIENYTVPAEFRKDPGNKKLGLCFRDEDELPASSSLSDSIYEALDHSEYLIVICTPSLPRSEWCEQEIRYFLKTHDRDHVLAVLADGTPEQSFSPLLLHVYDENGNIVEDCEPLAANIVGKDHAIDTKALRKEIVRIYAALLGCPFDALWHRERRARSVRLFTVSMTISAILLVFLTVLLERNARISEQNRELSRQISTVLTDEGTAKLDLFYTEEAVADALNALSSGDPAIYDHKAIRLLSDALGAYEKDKLRSISVYEQQTKINDFWVSEDERHVLLLENTGIIRCLSMDSFEEEWNVSSGDANSRLYTSIPDRILYKSQKGLYALSLADGTELWSCEHEEIYTRNRFQALSPDGSLFAVLDLAPHEETDYTGYPDREYCIRFIDTSDGSLAGMSIVQLDNMVPVLLSGSDEAKFTATFSRDGKILVFALPVNRTEEDGSKTQMVTIRMTDLKTMETSKVLGNDSMQIYEGFHINETHDSLLFSSLSYSGLLWMLKCPMPYVSADEVIYYTIGHHFQTPAGIYQEFNDYTSVNRCRMLVWKDRAMVFSDSTMFVFSTETTEGMKLYPMSGQIVNAYWLDEEKGLFEVICSDGYVIDYQCTDPLFEVVFARTADHELRRGIPVNGGISAENDSGFLLSLSADRPGQLIKSAFMSDPHAEKPDLPDHEGNFITRIRLIEGTDKALLYTKKDSDPQIITFDRVTGEEISARVYDDIPSGRLVPVDEDHFLSQSYIFGSDGSKERYGESFSGSDDIDPSEYYPLDHVILADGSILSVNTCTDYGLHRKYMRTDTEQERNEFWGILPELCPVWINGELMKSSVEGPEAMIMAQNWLDIEGLLSPSAYTVGANGLIVRYGTDLYIENDRMVMAEKPRFSIFDIHSGKLLKTEDPYPDAGSMMISASNSKPLVAISREDGHLSLFSTEDSSFREIPGYAAGETAAMAFSKDDRLFAVLRVSGRLDLYETESCTLVGSTVSMLLQDLMLENGININEIILRDMKDGGICILASPDNQSLHYCLLLDPDLETLLAEIPYVYEADLENGWIYTDQGQDRLLRYPLYTLEDLINWAEEDK